MFFYNNKSSKSHIANKNEEKTKNLSTKTSAMLLSITFVAWDLLLKTGNGVSLAKNLSS